MGFFLLWTLLRQREYTRIDVQEMHIDILCFTGHKSLLGPQGTGGMYVREGVKVRPLKTGGSGVQTYNKKHPAEMRQRWKQER